MEQVRGGSYAWVQPDGGWGLSNAGVVVGGSESLLVDTLFDLAHTRRMLEATAVLTEQAPIRHVVNTHGNGDHWFGNELVSPEASIVAAQGSVEDMHAVGPRTVQELVSAPGAVGDYGRAIFGRYDFTGITPRYPDHAFTGEHVVSVGGTEVLLVDVGPAHTRGDTVVYCERDRVVYTGDIMFAGGTPIMWEGPVQNWVAACRRILDLGADLAVPGHGPVSAVSRIREMVDYLEFVRDETVPRFEAGMTSLEAATDIDLGSFSGWPEAERLAVNVATVYRELTTETEPPSGPELFGCMAALLGTTKE
ncbi:MBL fold metallo-hydrolase [Nocardioides sp. CBS4Y-1]|uniref:MBL fold metallo-hydrolase n=1 Tax=Nocardioides acrostichi TaxID=2784339 RepID=A0A930UZ32_9ACTN|nr:MBL fold metallo-hydrolase [Nocardioides acrostichi]